MIETRARNASFRGPLGLVLPLLLLASVATANDAPAAGAPSVEAAAPAPTAEAPVAPVVVDTAALDEAVTLGETAADLAAPAAADTEAAAPAPGAGASVAPAATNLAAADLAAADLTTADLTTAPAVPESIPAEAAPVSSPPPGLAAVVDPTAIDRDSLLPLVHDDVAALGPLSIGTPDAGLLVNPRPMPEGPLWTIRNTLETWGTQETIDFVVTAIGTVAARFPDSPRVVIGDMSRPDGGRLNRHKSHQAGRDVDIGFYYASGEEDQFRLARKVQLDLPRTWALMRAFLTETDVDRIFVDRTLIAVLYRYARDEEQEDGAWLDDVFGRGERKGIVQHERRHKDHMHVRFYNRVAQEKGRVVYPLLVEAGVVGPPMVKHRVRRGETLGHIASQYATSVSAIRAANGLHGSQLRAGRSYLVPVRRVREDGEPVVVPPRRLPPPISTQAAAAPALEPTAPLAAPEPANSAPLAVAGGGRN